MDGVLLSISRRAGLGLGTALNPIFIPIGDSTSRWSQRADPPWR